MYEINNFPEDIDRLNLIENHIKVIFCQLNYLRDKLEELETEFNLIKKIK